MSERSTRELIELLEEYTAAWPPRLPNPVGRACPPEVLREVVDKLRLRLHSDLVALDHTPTTKVSREPCIVPHVVVDGEARQMLITSSQLGWLNEQMRTHATVWEAG